MRIKLTLNRTTKQRMLPMDYQYFISAWIYKVLKQADAEFAEFLHEKGYGNSDTKLYKLFCFSRLNFGKPILHNEQKLFEIKTQEVELQIGFDVPEAASNFVRGLFMQQEFYLGNKFNGIDFTVTKVESLAEPEFTKTMNYRLQTPWVVSYRTPEDKYAQYLKPEHELFQELSIKHLLEKYKNTKTEILPELPLDFKPESQYKRGGFLVKNGTGKQTRVVGNMFDFTLNAPVEIHKMLWNAGVSEKSSSGFGWCEIRQDLQDEINI